MGDLNQLEWLGLFVSLIGHYYCLYIVNAWSKKEFRNIYEVSRELIRSFFAPPGWAVQPLLFVVSGFLTASVFLFWKREFDETKDSNFALIMGFHIASVFLLQIWSTTASWGERWWWSTVGVSVLLTGTSTTVWALMGVEKAWLQFGLYSPLPVVAFLSIAVSAGFAADSTRLGRETINRLLAQPIKKGGQVMSNVGTVMGAGHQYPTGRRSKRGTAYGF